MDVIEKCVKEKTIIHAFILSENIVEKFNKELEKSKKTGSIVIEELIKNWLEEKPKAR